MGMWWSSNHCSTPTCASPSAPPPSSATPIFSRGLAVSALAPPGSSWRCNRGAGVSCAGAKRKKQQEAKKCVQATAHEKLPSNTGRGRESWVTTSFAQPDNSHKVAVFCVHVGVSLRPLR